MEYNAIIEKERKIQKLNNVLVSRLDKAIRTGNALKNGDYVTINFDIQCIPYELRNLLIERQNVLCGELSNDAPINENISIANISK